MRLAGASQTLPEAAVFGLVTALSAWGVLLWSKLVEGRFDRHASGNSWRRLPLLAVGAATGLAAWGLSRALLVEIPLERDSLLHAIAGEERPAIALVGFFTMLLGLRRWWRHADGYRPKRLRLRTVLLTGLWGLGCCVVFGVPIAWGLPSAVATSVVVQLAAVWTPARDRPHRTPIAG